MIERLPIKLNVDKNRVILQFLNVGEVRSKGIIEKIQAIPDSNCIELLNENINDFEHRHKNYKEKLLKNYSRICDKLKLNLSITEARKLLIGAYFSKEY